MNRYRALLVLAATLVLGSSVDADWLRFRGPNGSGVSAERTATPTTWSPDTVKWKAPLPGPGSSSPIVVGEKVFVTSWSGYGLDRENAGDQRNLRRHLVCLDRMTGNMLWSKTVAPYLPEDDYGGMFAEHGYASHTPVSDQEKVYVFFGKTGVLAFDLDGNRLWMQSVGTESGAHSWGSASSPILYQDLVIVPATAESEALVGLDKQTGREVWRAEAAGFNSTWGSPVLVRVNDQRTDLVMAIPGEMWGLNPATGKLAWYADAVRVPTICSSAVVDENGVVYAIEVGQGRGGGVAIRAGGTRDVTKSHVVWAGGQSNRVATPLVYQGKLYVVSRSTMTCLDASTGNAVFRGRMRSAPEPAREPPPQLAQDVRGDTGPRGAGRGSNGVRGASGLGGQDYGSPILADGKIYYTTRRGETFVVKAGDAFEQFAANRVTLDVEDFSATPAASDGELYIRSDKYLYCVAKSNDVPN